MRHDTSLDAKVPLWWLRALKGKENALKVLICLSAHANRERRAWPSAERIAELTDVRRDRVFAALKELRAAGIIETQHRHKSPSIHTLRFAVPENGIQDGPRVVPLKGTLIDLISVPLDGPHICRLSVPASGAQQSVPASGTQIESSVPVGGAMSTGQRCDEYRLHGPQTPNELDQEQRESARERAHAPTREKNKDDDDDEARAAVMRAAVQPLMATLLAELAAGDIVTLATYLDDRFMASTVAKLTRQLTDMASDAKFARMPVYRLVYAARDAFSARGRQQSLWDLKVWLRSVS